MALPKRYLKQHAKAKHRQRVNAQARHRSQHHQAQRTINALHRALHD